MSQTVNEYLNRLPRAVILNVMDEALDYMRQYNGRTKEDCILMALGAEVKEEELDGEITFPSVYSIKKLFSD